MSASLSISTSFIPSPSATTLAPGYLALNALTAVVAHATAELTPEKWAAAWRVLAHAAKIAGKDVAAWCACILARAHKPDLPVPSEVEEFCPLLEAAGLLGGGGK